MTNDRAPVSDAPDTASADARGDDIVFHVDGRELRVASHLSLAAALLNAGVDAFRTSVHGDARGPVCGMGTCHECRVTVDGVPHVRSCMQRVRAGMDVRTATDGAVRR